MDIKDLRKQIDTIDDEILDLFIKRMNVSTEVANYKKEHKLPVLDKQREREVLADMQAKAGDDEEAAYYLFTKIMELSRARQNSLLVDSSAIVKQIEKAAASGDATFPKTGSVACQGTEGSNAQIACDKLIPRGNIMYVKTFRGVFDAVESGLCRYGVVPIENSVNGSVRSVYELLQEKKLSIVRSTKLCVRHQLLAYPGASLEDIKVIYSHQQAIGQCGKFLSKHSSVKLVPCENTALAAQEVGLKADPTIAAIASPQCKELYGLECIAQDIQDSDNNYTRFICITKDPVIYADANKISLIVSCDNKPGALCDILSKLAAHGINMSKLESCPVAGRDFEFMFIFDLDASIHESGVLPMLADLERSYPGVVFLGSYDMV